MRKRRLRNAYNPKRKGDRGGYLQRGRRWVRAGIAKITQNGVYYAKYLNKDAKFWVNNHFNILFVFGIIYKDYEEFTLTGGFKWQVYCLNTFTKDIPAE